ncbi:MAG: hypothetical protein GY852_10245 [bacterium]|nr:hypothetical protein [bacterium]
MIESKVNSIVLFGSGANSLSEYWSGVVEIFITDTLDLAAEKAQSISSPDGIVLLSPGCASFDQYSSFEERGDHFKRIVQALK